MNALSSPNSPVQDNTQPSRLKPEEVAAYAASMLVHLRKMAVSVDLATLAYLLDMARLEAEGVFE